MDKFGPSLISGGTAWFGIGIIDWIDPPAWADFAIAGALTLAGILLLRLFHSPARP